MSSCDIKSVYTNIRHDLFYKAIDYWIKKMINEILLLRRFTKATVLEWLSKILEFNYFYINNYFYHQIKGTAIGTIFAVVGSNGSLFWRKNVFYFTTNLSKILCWLFHLQLVSIFRWCFSKWLIQFNIQDFYKNINEPDPKT